MLTAFKPAAAYLLCQGAMEVWWQMSAAQPSRWQDPFHLDRQPVCGTDRQKAPAPCLGKDRSSTADPTPHADHLSPPLSAQKGSAHLVFLSILTFFFFIFPYKIIGWTGHDRRGRLKTLMVFSILAPNTKQRVSSQVQGLWASPWAQGHNYLCKPQTSRARPPPVLDT